MPTSTPVLYVSCLVNNDSPLSEAFYRAARIHHCVMVIKVCLQWVNPTNDAIEMSPVGHDCRMLDNVCKCVLYPLPDAVVRFAIAAGVYNIVAKTCYSPVLAAARILRASEVDRLVEDSSG